MVEKMVRKLSGVLVRSGMANLAYPSPGFRGISSGPRCGSPSTPSLFRRWRARGMSGSGPQLFHGPCSGWPDGGHAEHPTHP